MGRLLKKTLEKLVEERHRIQREGTESFRQIRQTEPKNGREELADQKEYEAVLLSHFQVGNADFQGAETEIKEFLQENKMAQKTIMPWVIGIGELLVVTAVIGMGIEADNTSLLAKFIGLIGGLAGFVVLTGGYIAGRRIDMRQRFRELEKKANDLLDNYIKRINKQFAAMVAYRSYVYHRREAIRAMNMDLENHKNGKANERELELEEALWNKLKRIAGEEISYSYHQCGQEHTCTILGQEIRCPYYFLEEIIVVPEMNTERNGSG